MEQALDNGVSEEAKAIESEGAMYREMEDKRDPKPEVIVLAKLRAGDQPFASWGYVDLKVVKNNVEKIMRLPIKSVGMAEVIEEISRKMPEAPVRTEIVRKDSKYGQALGLRHDKLTILENTLDPEFQKKLREYEIESLYRVVLHALAIDVEDAQGNKLPAGPAASDPDPRLLKETQAGSVSNIHLGPTYCWCSSPDGQPHTPQERDAFMCHDQAIA